MPLVNRTFDQLIDFTRTSAATFVNSSGNIASTPQSRNLLTFTQEFDNAAWTKTNATVVPNQNPAAASLGSELVTNGDFATDTVWTKGGGWTITGGLAVRSPAGSGSILSQPIALVAGRLYRVEYTVSAYSAASVQVQFSGGSDVNGATRSANGTYVEYLTAVGGNNTLGFVCGAAAASLSIDNVSVREVVGGWNVAPDGTSTADTLLDTAVSNIHYAYQAATPAIAANTSYTVSVFAKASTLGFVTVGVSDISSGSLYAVAVFNLSNGTLATSGAAGTGYAVSGTAITSVGNGWYRCAVTVTTGSSVAFARAIVGINKTGVISATAGGLESYLGNGSGILIWGAQLEQASAATDYTRNVGGVFPPRFDYDPVTLAPRGLLIEEQRVNLLLRSQEFDNAAWSKLRSSVTANATTAPDGTVTADKLVEDTTASDTHFVLQSQTASSSTTYTYSVFLKAGERTRASLQDGAGSNAIGNFDLSNGTVVSTNAATATITNFGNGWYRCTITFTTGAAQTAINCRIFLVDTGTNTSFTGNGTSGIFIYGAQLEAGAFATSYIPTVASQVTRTADVAAINAPNFASWYNQSEGTILVEAVTFKPTSVGVTVLAVDVSDGGINNRHLIGPLSNLVTGRTVVGGVTQVDINTAYTANATEKLAYAYKVNDFAFFRNGSQVGTDTSGTIPTVDRMFIGNAAGSAAFWNGWLRSIRYYPTRLTQAQGQALTA